MAPCILGELAYGRELAMTGTLAACMLCMVVQVKITRVRDEEVFPPRYIGSQKVETGFEAYCFVCKESTHFEQISGIGSGNGVEL